VYVLYFLLQWIGNYVKQVYLFLMIGYATSTQNMQPILQPLNQYSM